VKLTSSPGFEADPLVWLDEFAASGDPVRWIAPRQLCVADARIARAVLRNDGGLYPDHSDFFATDYGTFGPRPLQVELGRAARHFIEARLPSLPLEAEAARLGPASRWPRAGGTLLMRALHPLLAAPDRRPAFRRRLAGVVEHGILARDAGGDRGLARRLRRFAFVLAFDTEREARARGGAGEPRDLLDLVLDIGAAAPSEQLIEVYLGFVFALVSSVGFALAWSVLLAVRHGQTAAPPRRIALEALRLYPVAWLLGRRPAAPHRLAGIDVGPEDEVVVCPYAVHRSPLNWAEPTRFDPGRWAAHPDRGGWIPFGAGPHACAGVSTTFLILDRLLGALFEEHDLSVAEVGASVGLGTALAPPPFVLRRTPRR